MQSLFGARLRQWAADSRTPPAIVMPGRELAFAELCAQVAGCASWLAREGCRPPEAVGVTIGDDLANLIVSLALLDLGVPQIHLPTRDPPAVRLRLAQRVGATRVVAIDPQHAIAELALSVLTPAGLGAGARDEPRGAADPDAPAIYFTSSGTTGEPKLLALSQRILAGRAEGRQLAPGERALIPGTIEDYPAKSSRLYCVYRGLTSVLQAAAGSPPLAVHELCTRHRVTRLDANVLQAMDLVHDAAAGARYPPGLHVYTGGSRVPESLRQAFAAAGIALIVQYGTREVGVIAITCAGDREDAAETVGKPRAAIQIVDDEGVALPPGEIGEIRVRTANMIGEYFRDPVATARHFRDGWFHPGDVGSLTPRGFLCLHGRNDDRMNLNGIKIFPLEIERVLEAHPAVKAAAAFAVPSAVHGDIPVAAVELRDAATVGVDDLMARARAHLGARAPRRIVVLAQLPRNPAGKIVKRDLLAALGPVR